MKIGQYNKATVAIIASAGATLAGHYLGWDIELQTAATTVFTALLVWLVPNRA